MIFLRKMWRRGAVHRYFADLPPIDRATALIVLALLLAWAISFAAIVRNREAAVMPAPRLTAPPFTMDFAAAAASMLA